MSKSIQMKNKNNEKIYPHPFFPIGSIYLSVVDTNPSIWFGGKWEQIAKGRTLVGVDTSDTDFNTVKKTGGSKYLQKHYHKGLAFGGAISPSEQDIMVSYFQGNSNRIALEWSRPGTIGNESSNVNTYSEGQGNSGNLQPYFTCYIWCRIA